MNEPFDQAKALATENELMAKCKHTKEEDDQLDSAASGG
jgi:hypothetical protein